jgi:hypothetical protein
MPNPTHGLAANQVVVHEDVYWDSAQSKKFFASVPDDIATIGSIVKVDGDVCVDLSIAMKHYPTDPPVPELASWKVVLTSSSASATPPRIESRESGVVDIPGSVDQPGGAVGAEACVHTDANGNCTQAGQDVHQVAATTSRETLPFGRVRGEACVPNHGLVTASTQWLELSASTTTKFWPAVKLRWTFR